MYQMKPQHSAIQNMAMLAKHGAKNTKQNANVCVCVSEPTYQIIYNNLINKFVNVLHAVRWHHTHVQS
jgi:hypothetical protein